MRWGDVPDAVDDWTARVAGPASSLRREAADAWTGGHVGYYLQPGGGRVGLHGEDATAADLALCKAAAGRATGWPVVPLSLSHRGPGTGPGAAHDDVPWIKVAYSPAIRRLGELLNFFPGRYPGGLPNAPGPAAAMLTSGLVGAGLGYGLGRLGGAVLPRGYGDRLGRTGAILGGLAGILPGAAWAGANRATGHGLGDPWPLDPPAGSLPAPEPDAPWLTGRLKDAADALAAIPVPDPWRSAIAKWAASDTFGAVPGVLDVNVDALGRTLWDSGASPQLAGSTMGAIYAARQLPDPRSRPGVVTGAQLGQLAMRTAGDYTQGLLVGHALNAVIGTPYGAPAFGLGAAALGVIASVIPRLFGG